MSVKCTFQQTSPSSIVEVLAYVKQVVKDDSYVQAKLVADTGDYLLFPLLPLVTASPLLASAAAQTYHGADCIVIHLKDFSIKIVALYLDYITTGQVVHNDECLYQLHELCTALGTPHCIEISQLTDEAPPSPCTSQIKPTGCVSNNSREAEPDTICLPEVRTFNRQEDHKSTVPSKSHGCRKRLHYSTLPATADTHQNGIEQNRKKRRGKDLALLDTVETADAHCVGEKITEPEAIFFPELPVVNGQPVLRIFQKQTCTHCKEFEQNRPNEYSQQQSSDLQIDSVLPTPSDNHQNNDTLGNQIQTEHCYCLPLLPTEIPVADSPEKSNEIQTRSRTRQKQVLKGR